jgi:hypothetical protein
VLLGAIAAAGMALIAASALLFTYVQGPPPRLAGPSNAGLNYAFPHTVAGAWLGTEWLLTASDRGSWAETAPAFAADLDFIQQHNLGKVLRLFIGLDQAIEWDASGNFAGFDEQAMQHLSDAFYMLDVHGIKVVAVLYDQEEVASRGNFHFVALDGSHPAMRAGYLRATELFLQRFASRKTVIGWDLFNEPYNSLGRDGHLPSPPHEDPVSPNYSDSTVHAWLQDLYRTAKKAAPNAHFTASDSTDLYWSSNPDLSKYEDVVDFYDIHVYDDNPAYPNWRWMLDKPYIVGEAGASTKNQHYEDQTFNSKAVTYLLDHAGTAGVSFVLIQGPAFSSHRDGLTPSGTALSDFLAHPPPATSQSDSPLDTGVAAVKSIARRVRGIFHS